MSDYDEDFEDYNDTLNDRSKKGTIKKENTRKFTQCNFVL